MNKQKGFTIIELVVVIAIIAILAGIVLINVSGYINKAKDATIKADLHTIQTALISANSQNSGTWSSTGTANDYTLAMAQVISSGGTSGFAPIFGTGAFCATSTLPSGAAGGWCVDSTGYAGVLASGKCTGTTYTCQ